MRAFPFLLDHLNGMTPQNLPLTRIIIIYIVTFFTTISSDFHHELEGQSAEEYMTDDIKSRLAVQLPVG
jgi:hypothetical protein